MKLREAKERESRMVQRSQVRWELKIPLALAIWKPL